MTGAELRAIIESLTRAVIAVDEAHVARRCVLAEALIAALRHVPPGAEHRKIVTVLHGAGEKACGGTRQLVRPSGGTTRSDLELHRCPGCEECPS